VIDPLVLAAAFFIAALLYASVGHAGASAYLAIMALAAVSPDVARPTALALNIIVASFVSYRFWRGGYISWRALLPFVLGAIPFAFLGGALPVAPGLYKKLVGVVLLFAAAGMAMTARRAIANETGHAQPSVPTLPALGIGAGIGLLSGLTGTGGGIFLSPVVLLAGWAETRAASGMAAIFILGNSIAGLSGNLSRLGSLPSSLPIYAVAVVAGAFVGSELGNRRAPTLWLRRALAAVLVIAGVKLIFAG
jgi:uncharacterized membrane protein YfcA